jgi:hypothetical protein
VNSRLTQVAAMVGATAVLLLNAFLILEIVGVPFPGFAVPG